MLSRGYYIAHLRCLDFVFEGVCRWGDTCVRMANSGSSGDSPSRAPPLAARKERVERRKEICFALSVLGVGVRESRWIAGIHVFVWQTSGSAGASPLYLTFDVEISKNWFDEPFDSMSGFYRFGGACPSETARPPARPRPGSQKTVGRLERRPQPT